MIAVGRQVTRSIAREWSLLGSRIDLIMEGTTIPEDLVDAPSIH